MEIIVKINTKKNGEGKYAVMIGRTTIKDFILTFDEVAIALALGMSTKDIKALDVGEYKIN